MSSVRTNGVTCSWKRRLCGSISRIHTNRSVICYFWTGKTRVAGRDSILVVVMMMMMMMMIIIIIIIIIIIHYEHITLSLIWSQLKVSSYSLLRQKKGIKTLNRRPNNNKSINTVVSVAVVFVVMNIIIKLRRVSGVHNARRRKFPRGP